MVAMVARRWLVGRSKAVGLAVEQKFKGSTHYTFWAARGAVLGHPCRCESFSGGTAAAAADRGKAKARAKANATAYAATWEGNPAAHSEALSKTWDGFQSWRAAPLREDFYWEPEGKNKGEGGGSEIERRRRAETQSVVSALPEGSTLSEFGKEVLETADPLAKALLTHEAYRRFYDVNDEGKKHLEVGSAVEARREVPEKPAIVSAKECPSPKKSGLPLSSYMLHNLAHIELNAIDLAWDTILCFAESQAPALPADFYLDFLRVADDESRHLRWCLQRLREMDSYYGSLPSHGLLWESGLATRKDLLGRLVAVPMVQEARGLDAGPRLVQKLRGAGDNRSADIVEKIAREERAHVAVGVYWFQYACHTMQIGDVRGEFHRVATQYCQDMIRGPFNTVDREAVGLMSEWYNELAV